MEPLRSAPQLPGAATRAPTERRQTGPQAHIAKSRQHKRLQGDRDLNGVQHPLPHKVSTLQAGNSRRRQLFLNLIVLCTLSNLPLNAKHFPHYPYPHTHANYPIPPQALHQAQQQSLQQLQQLLHPPRSCSDRQSSRLRPLTRHLPPERSSSSKRHQHTHNTTNNPKSAHFGGPKRICHTGIDHGQRVYPQTSRYFKTLKPSTSITHKHHQQDSLKHHQQPSNSSPTTLRYAQTLFLIPTHNTYLTPATPHTVPTNQDHTKYTLSYIRSSRTAHTTYHTQEKLTTHGSKSSAPLPPPHPPCISHTFVRRHPQTAHSGPPANLPFTIPQPPFRHLIRLNPYLDFDFNIQIHTDTHTYTIH